MSSGGGGGDIEKRLSRLEASFENVSVALTDIRSDIRLIIGGGVSGGVLLLGAIIGSHLRLQDEIRVLHAKDDKIIAMVNAKSDAVIAMVDAKTEAIVSRGDAKDDAIIAMINTKHDAILERLSRLEVDLAVALARNDKREASQAGTKRAAPDPASPSAGRETLH